MRESRRSIASRYRSTTAIGKRQVWRRQSSSVGGRCAGLRELACVRVHADRVVEVHTCTAPKGPCRQRTDIRTRFQQHRIPWRRLDRMAVARLEDEAIGCLPDLKGAVMVAAVMEA